MRMKSTRGMIPLFMIVVTLFLVACGGSEPLTVRELEQTREAAVAEARAEATAETEARETGLRSRAPEGTVFAETEPDRGHDSNISIPFGALPPNGGTHNPAWQRCEVYDAPIKPEHAVHALEHGAVWITYQTDIDGDSIDRLERVARGEPAVLVSPYPNQRSEVVLTAWGIQLELESANDARVQEFVDAYAGGAQSPEPGATCTTGVQDTVDG